MPIRQAALALATQVELESAINAVHPLVIPRMAVPSQNRIQLAKTVTGIAFNQRQQRLDDRLIRDDRRRPNGSVTRRGKLAEH